MKKLLLVGFLLLGLSGYANDEINDFRLGFGGAYGLERPSGEKDITHIGGYFLFIGRESFFNKRIYSEAGGELIGIGSSKTSGVKNATYYDYDGRIKFGVNVASQANPLFVNVGYSFDAHSTAITAGKALRTGLHMVGVDLQGFIKANEKLTYEYNVGYHYVFHGYHYLEDTRSGINDYSYAIKGHIGYTYQLSPKIAYFLNLKAKYYDLATSNFNTPDFNRPKTKHLIGMVELGLQF